MDLRHFSHNHSLVFHQIAQGSEIHCSGCKSKGSDNVYVCWQCGYFLHEHCFRAERSLKHPSHPLHPLSLVPSPTYPSGSFFCNSCSLIGDGFSYSCSECEFDIHVHCAHMPNPNPHIAHSPAIFPNCPQNGIYPPPIQNIPFPSYPPPHNATIPSNPNPQFTAYPHNQNNQIPAYPQPNQTVPTYSTVVNSTTTNLPPAHQPTTTPVHNNNPYPKPPTMIKHFSHPHVLKAMEIEQKNTKICSACEVELTGSAFCCTEPYCTFILHKSCFDSPREFRHKSHLQHPLTLVPAPPYGDRFTCNACLKDGKAFAYTCATCSFDLHIDCIHWPESLTRSDHKHALALYYSSPAAAPASRVGTFVCDVCREPVHEKAWVYNCRECDFGTHLECVTTGVKEENVSGSDGNSQEVVLTETEIKFAILQMLLEAQGRN